MPSILMIPQKRFPCEHAMLETVYSRLLPQLGYQITWMMLSSEAREARVCDWNGTRAHIFPAPAGKGLRPLAKRLSSWVRLLSCAARLAWREHFDVIQVRNAVTAGLVAKLISKRTIARFVYQFSFPVAESLARAAREGRTRLPWVQIRLGTMQIALRNLLVRKADLVLAISEEMRRQLLAAGIPAERVFTLPLGTECPSQPDPDRVGRLRTRLELDGHPVVIYFGTISPERELGFVVRVAARVKREQPATRWLMVGPVHGGEEARLLTLARQLDVDESFVFTGAVPRAEVPAHIALANVSVSPIPPIPLFWLSSPTKTVEALALECPVVATNIPDQAALISASGGGVIALFEEEAFASAVCHLLAEPAKAAQMGRAGKAYVCQYRSYDYLTRSLDQRYRELLGLPPAMSDIGTSASDRRPLATPHGK